MDIKKIAKGAAGLIGLISLGALGTGLPLMAFKNRTEKLVCNARLLNQVGLKDYLDLESVSNKQAGTFRYKTPISECESYPFISVFGTPEGAYNYGNLATCDYNGDGKIDRTFCAGNSDGVPYRFVWERK